MKYIGSRCVRRTGRSSRLVPIPWPISGSFRKGSWTIVIQSIIPSPRPCIQPFSLINSLQFRFHSTGSSLFSNDDDTIFAVSTPSGRGGIAVIRISGPAAHPICCALSSNKRPPKSRVATVRTLYDPRSTHGSVILDPAALVLLFDGPKTVTGEDVAELHVHGGSATVKAVLAAIPRCVTRATAGAGFTHSVHRVRYAESGEFTRRAFMNNRLDLSQVEALSDILSAETEKQLLAVTKGAAGILRKRYEMWRSKLLEARAQLEALIDFSEDQHFDESPQHMLGVVARDVHDICTLVKNYERASKRGELLRKGIRIALVGPPNVGKSSLMNMIVGREASIVSSEAGTTRDIVEVSLDLQGYLCSFADTAGFRSKESSNGQKIGAIEKEGINRARAKIQESDFVIVMGSVETVKDSNPLRYFIHYDTETLKLAQEAKAYMIVINKIDQISPEEFLGLKKEFIASRSPRTEEMNKVLGISCEEAMTEEMGIALSKDAGNIHELTDQLVNKFAAMTEAGLNDGDNDVMLSVTERQRILLEECREHLVNYLSVINLASDLDAEGDIVIAAEHLRHADHCLAKITGKGDSPDVEEVLGVIFETFCVGK